jgi:pimeloyl-ACP methyl ester carboxylesterase
MESKYIIANGIRIHYQEAGNGPLVILLHGFPEFWYGWKHQIPALSQQFRVVAPDMRGYNLSDKPALVSDYKIETLAKDIADLVVALGEDKAYIVGHDWGAAVAWAVAGLHPEVVKKLVILNVPHPGEMKRAFLSFNFAQWSKSWYIFFFQLPFLPQRIVGTARFFRGLFDKMSTRKDAFSEVDVATYVAAYNQPGTVRATIAYYRAAFRAIFTGAKDLPPITMPVMMLWGEQDKALGKELTYRTKDYCTNTLETHYDPPSGHFVQHDNPDWVNAHLLRFLGEEN